MPFSFCFDACQLPFGGGEFEGSWSVYGVESWIVILGGHFLFTCSDTFALVSMHSVTDRRTDGQTTLSYQQPIILRHY